MKNWLDTLYRLRTARQAREEFLMREFVDRTIIGPMLLDRLAADLSAIEAAGSFDNFAPGGWQVMPTVQAGRRIADDRYVE